MFLIAVQEGHLEISPSSVRQVLGVTTQDMEDMDIMESFAPEDTTLMPVGKVSGSGFNNHGGKLGWNGFIKKVKKYGPQVLDGVTKTLNFVNKNTGISAVPILGDATQALTTGATALNSVVNRKKGRGMQTQGYGRLMAS